MFQLSPLREEDFDACEGRRASDVPSFNLVLSEKRILTYDEWRENSEDESFNLVLSEKRILTFYEGFCSEVQVFQLSPLREEDFDAKVYKKLKNIIPLFQLSPLREEDFDIDRIVGASLIIIVST